MNEIVVVDGDDWLGLYVNGELALQGHGDGRHADILAFGALHAPYTVRLCFADTDWLSDAGELPQCLEDVRVDSEETPCADLAAQ